MELVEAYRNQREMTPEVLLDLTRSHKLHQVQRALPHDLSLHGNLQVTQEDIEDMGETLKKAHFGYTR